MAIIQEEDGQGGQNPIAVFSYALKAPETKRQYPQRLRVFFNFLKLDGSLEEQARQFQSKARQNQQWAHGLMQLIEF